MTRFSLGLAMTAALCGCAHPPSGRAHPAKTAVAEAGDKEPQDEAIAERILGRIQELKRTFPMLENMQSARAGLHVEHGVTWVLDDPTQPASRLNALRASFEKNGFWLSLRFYRGEWRGAAMFVPIEFGDLKLWFSYGHRADDDPAVIVAVAKIIDEEKRAFDAAQTQ